jgi:hypothetical protein
MNTIETRQAALLATILVIGAGIIAGDLHKVIIGWAWPHLEAFWDTFIGIQVWA